MAVSNSELVCGGDIPNGGLDATELVQLRDVLQNDIPQRITKTIRRRLPPTSGDTKFLRQELPTIIQDAVKAALLDIPALNQDIVPVTTPVQPQPDSQPGISLMPTNNGNNAYADNPTEGELVRENLVDTISAPEIDLWFKQNVPDSATQNICEASGSHVPRRDIPVHSFINLDPNFWTLPNQPDALAHTATQDMYEGTARSLPYMTSETQIAPLPNFAPSMFNFNPNFSLLPFEGFSHTVTPSVAQPHLEIDDMSAGNKWVEGVNNWKRRFIGR
jgi:hypothetical protein